MGSVIGSAIEELDTPALLLDGPASDRNIQQMADFFRGRKCQLRPHFKNHKCTQLARRQLEAGSAVGMTCAKLGEAEVLADAGFDDILIANQVVGARKLQRLVDLAGRVRLRVAVDDTGQAKAISQVADKAGVTVGVLGEVDVGMGRCGMSPGQPALDVARQIVGLPGIRFDGLQAYEGHLVPIAEPEERAAMTRDDMKKAVDTRRLLEENGIAVGVISGGSTATYSITGAMDGIDELQAGTYVTMDHMYHPLMPTFEMALSILARVISRPKPDVAVLDVGVKGAGDEFGPPVVKNHPTAEIPWFLSEEHCVVHEVADWVVGQAVELIPSHACTTCNLYRQLHVHDGGRVVDVWPIEAAGRLA